MGSLHEESSTFVLTSLINDAIYIHKNSRPNEFHVEDLPSDLLEYICNFLDPHSILRFISTSNKYNLPEKFFMNYLYQLYGNIFWKRAMQRNVIHHTQKWKTEFIRIESLQKIIEELENRRWTCDDFYELWYIEDSFYTHQ